MENILITCNHCASQYSVSDNLLTPGKRVRCSVCSHIWEYQPEIKNTQSKEGAKVPDHFDETESPLTARKPIIPRLPLESISKPTIDKPEKEPSTARHSVERSPLMPRGTNYPDPSALPTQNDVEIARRPSRWTNRWSKWFANSITFFMILIIAGNIVFWLYYVIAMTIFGNTPVAAVVAPVSSVAVPVSI